MLLLFVAGCGQTPEPDPTQTISPTDVPTEIAPSNTPLPTSTHTPTNTPESLEFFTPTPINTPTPIPEFANVNIWRLAVLDTETLLVVFVSLPPENALIGPVEQLSVRVNHSPFNCEHLAEYPYRLYCSGPTVATGAKIIAQIYLPPHTDLNQTDMEILAWQGILTVP